MATHEFLQQRCQKQKARIQVLETQVNEMGSSLRQKDDQLCEQSVELATLAPTHTLSKAMYDFVKKVAQSQSKFAKEARELL